MIPLIDADILVYEVGSSGEYVDDEGEPQVREFDFVANLLDTKIREICEECWADDEPILFLTNSESTTELYNRMYRFTGEQLVYKPNFREAVATVNRYKGNRDGKKKPFHTKHLISYMLAKYNCVVANGMEADDMLGVYQRMQDDTIIITRDKDLRINPGMHYGWQCGKQEAWGPEEVDEWGGIEVIEKSGKKQIKGTGLKFFYSQVLTGDTTDDYPGLPGCGAVKALEALGPLETEDDLRVTVAELYMQKYPDEWRERMTEQAQLAWMVNELTADGEPVMWELPDGFCPQD